MKDTPGQGGRGGDTPPVQMRGAALEPAPRPVPALLRVYLHALYSLPGVFFLGVGLIGFFAFGVNSDWKAAAFLLPTAAARGTITGQYRAYGTIGGGRHPGDGGGTPIYALTYTFAGTGGVPHRGVSYVTSGGRYQPDTTGAPDPDSPVGLTVSVQYVQGHPALSRIRHLRTGVFEAYALATVAFPLAGLFLLRGCLRLARRTCLLLAEGRQDPGTGNLFPPPGQERAKDPPGGFEVTDFMTGPPRIAGGQLHPPAPGRIIVVFGLLALMLLVDIAVFRQAVGRLGY